MKKTLLKWPPRHDRDRKPGFIESMECLAVAQLPEGPAWSDELKLDGYRLEAIKEGGKVLLYPRRGNVLNDNFSYVANALEKQPDNTVLDGEVVALDATGRSHRRAVLKQPQSSDNMRFGATEQIAMPRPPMRSAVRR